MRFYSKKIFTVCAFSFLVSFLSGCAKYSFLNQNKPTFALFEQKEIEIYINEFSDVRPTEEKKGLTKQTKKILSFASKDSDFKEKISDAVTQRIRLKLEENGFHAAVLTNNIPGPKRYILEGEIEHFQVVMRLPNTTFIPYLGTVATIITKDEFNVVGSVKVNLKDAENNKVLFSQLFDASEDINLSTGPLNVNRFGRGINYRFKLLDEALNNIAEQIAQKTKTVLAQENTI